MTEVNCGDLPTGEYEVPCCVTPNENGRGIILDETGEIMHDYPLAQGSGASAGR